MSTTEDTAAQLRSATAAFDALFANQIGPAKDAFARGDSPFHLMGQGVCVFLEAALGMESGLMADASRCLAQSEAGARKMLKSAAKGPAAGGFPPGIEWEIMQADAVVLLGLTNALSESYMGYVQCIYALNSAHSKFTKLYKTVFPNGIDATPAPTPVSSTPSLLSPLPSPGHAPSPSSASSGSSAASIHSTHTLKSSPSVSSFFRWGSSSRAPSPAPAAPLDPALAALVTAGTAFGYGLFSLVFSLLPARARSVVGVLGFRSSRPVALRALAVAAETEDVHGVFAGLVLMTYWGVVLLLSGWQADEAGLVARYQRIVDKVTARYPTGALWILNRAKIQRMTHDPTAAIATLQAGLAADREHAFREADTLLVFELAWTLLAQRRYREAGEMFVRITELNSWSHATYYFLAAGCYFSLGDKTKAQELLDAVPALLERKKVGGKDLPTEVFIKKKLAFYKSKQTARGGAEAKFVEAIRISPAEEMAIFWNTHARIEEPVARAHIAELSALTPAVAVTSPYLAAPRAAEAGAKDDLDTGDELAVRALLLGITHRALGPAGHPAARALLADAHQRQVRGEVKVSTWVGGVALFETAVLTLKEADAAAAALAQDDAKKEKEKELWAAALTRASTDLDRALALATGSNTDLSSRLDSRIVMLRDEIGLKRETLGIAA